MKPATLELEVDGTALKLANQFGELLHRALELDGLSPAARAAEERSLRTEAQSLIGLIAVAAAARAAGNALTPNVATDAAARALLERANCWIGEALAGQGDHAAPELVQLQHAIASFLNPETQPTK